ncbi:phenylalanyl-tRNA synthetase beta subunit [Paenibacillus cellulosilyticus]|uniref:Phenylalanine--tRNA ligase beta subunit n=1 Tax=Paenibacillus cellulosilyticus TaxID=375489 RepID=A0A2V2YYJ9_9BACL|nr:phenylalanine--tRNA ligase subunit beta [Paenibacillus cellulosilyticus]PWW07424.1 phenylalanyl-tRNA synthetase beta subunit [Paenibacillus cellulosilyticus]QKS44413.1 phenylalanine--tRNA ligase subunit beta [Paenibacillus cellulosilyticus]
MNVSYQWLNEYIDVSDLTAKEIAEQMTRGGIEIDVVESRNKGVSGVVVGYVVSKEKHPDADKLNVCQVDVGTGENLQIVCGARNVDAGQKVPVATVGAKLPGDLNIKRAKLRGVESQGMICSAKELGLNEKLLPKEQQEGILVLPADTPIGQPIGKTLAIDDEVLELDLTPNRSDCLSMLGTAYEVAALTGREVKLPSTAIMDSPELASSYLKVSIEAKDLCSHYTARYIRGVTIAPSPLWLANRLMAAGIRPINNVVDVTNYVMLEYGQPLHAFDASKVAGGRIVVRLAQEGETLTTLDDQERKLEPQMLVIADSDKAVALAGVMGGANSEVTADTTDIILESARFDGSTVRRTSRQLGLRSESSARFEKEVDPGRVIPALDRAASLLEQIAGGHVAEGIVEAVAATQEPAVVQVTLSKINSYLGTSLSKLEVEAIFTRLGFQGDLDHNGTFTITVPTRRGDITRDVDLIEEVARLYGYDNIPTTPIEGSTTPGALTKPQAIRRELRKRLTDSGLNEVISYSFTGPERTALFPALTGDVRPIRLAMPMSEERSVLRTSLLAQLLDMAVYNRNRKNDNIAVFELGSVYHTEEETLTQLPHEKHRFGLLLTGNAVQAAWNQKAVAYDFYHAKGIVETIMQTLGVSGRVRYEAAAPEGFHPGRTAAVKLQTEAGEITLGYVGQLHPQLQQQMDLSDTYAAELELAPLYEYANAAIVYQTLPRYPAMERDIAVVVDSAVEAGRLLEKALETAAGLLESIRVFDVFTGEKLGAGKKSVALSLVYRHAERTLTDEEVTELHGAVVTAIEQTFGAELRK